MLKKMPNLSRFLLLIVLPLLVLAAYGYHLLGASVVPYEEQLTLTGSHGEVAVEFDGGGIASVKAQSDRDAYFAQGYLHGAERLWQMELQRRLASGRLAELFGAKAVNMDIWMRTLGLQQAVDSAWDNLDEPVKQALTAYSAGVNAWISQAEVLSPQFLLFDLQPEPWQPTDSLLWQKVFALNLGQNLHQEITRLQGLKQLSAAQLRTFYPFDNDYAQNLSVNEGNVNEGNDHWNSAFNDLNMLAQQWHIGGQFVGSNAWAVSGKHSASGKPLLANDPHLSVQQPSLWYAMALEGDKLAAQGMSLVGLPGIILGKNRHISWGAASLMADQQDLFVLDIPLGKPNVYRVGDKELPIELRHEFIHIRADSPQWLNNKVKPLQLPIRTTAIGPVITDAIEGTGYDLALRWSALDETDSTLEAFYQLQYAQNPTEFKSAAAKLKNPGLQLVYADKNGTIGTQAAAFLPNRAQGDGTLPALAALENGQWRGYVDFAELPSSWNPASGFVVAANHLPGKLNISHEWAPDSRLRRIETLLQGYIDKGTPMTLDHMAQMQKDEVDFGVAKLLQHWLTPDFIAAVTATSTARAKGKTLSQVSAKTIESALSLMQNWQADFDRNSAAPSIYHYWSEAVVAGLFAPDEKRNGLIAPVNQALLSRVHEPQLLTVFSADNSLWCREKAACEQLIVTAFSDALDALKQQTRSEDFEQWQWGQLHRVRYVAKPLGQIRFVDGWVNQDTGVGGSANTINAANATTTQDGTLVKSFGSAFRSVFDLGNGQAMYSLPTGQSGHLLSPYYDNMHQAYYGLAPNKPQEH